MPTSKTAHFKLDSLASLIMLIFFVIGIFFILRGIFIILSWIAPILLIAAFILDKSVVINYVKWLIELARTNPPFGIAAIILSIVGYMAVFPYLFIKALLKKKIRDIQQQQENAQQGELIDFEEIESQPKSDRLEMPPLQKQNPNRTESKSTSQKRNEYDQLFE